MKIYIANLDDSIDPQKLNELFSSYGSVHSSEIITDVFTGVSRGFGYVEMEAGLAQQAITALDQTVVCGLTITVKEAPIKKEQQGSYKVGHP